MQRWPCVLRRCPKFFLRKKIQACANKFLRTIYFLKPRDSVRSLMKENKLMSVNQIYELETCKIMQQVVLEVAPQPLLDLFENQIRPLTTQTRSSSHFIPCKTNRIKCRQSIRHCGPIVWNSLPSCAKWEPISENHLSSKVPLIFTKFLSNAKDHIINESPFI